MLLFCFAFDGELRRLVNWDAEALNRHPRTVRNTAKSPGLEPSRAGDPSIHDVETCGMSRTVRYQTWGISADSSWRCCRSNAPNRLGDRSSGFVGAAVPDDRACPRGMGALDGPGRVVEGACVAGVRRAGRDGGRPGERHARSARSWRPRARSALGIWHRRRADARRGRGGGRYARRAASSASRSVTTRRPGPKRARMAERMGPVCPTDPMRMGTSSGARSEGAWMVWPRRVWPR